jgi:hypothetical protein
MMNDAFDMDPESPRNAARQAKPTAPSRQTAVSERLDPLE